MAGDARVKRFARTALAVVVVAGALTVAMSAFAWRPAIDPVEPTAASAVASAFDRPVVERGAKLAALGNCTSCHTTVDGVPFAGGVPLATPFGTIYGSNVTPAPRTGIGRWSEPAFVRAMRDGVSRDGQRLYPAFPYDHFRGTDDADLHALYAFLMTRDPFESTPPPNDLVFPLGWRPLLAGWDLLFLRDAPAPGPSNDAVARGDRLVDALGHCGACHTPRNALQAEKRDARLAGAVVEGWYAPPLNADSPSPVVWTVDAMTRYLRSGIAPDHAMAGGPMQEVTASLAKADAADVSAIATSIVASMGPPTDARRAREAASRARASQPTTTLPFDASDRRLALGAQVYATACAGCHDRGRDVGSNGALRLPLAVALYDAEPASLLRLIREGIAPPVGERGRWMPAFGDTLTDDQLVALATYLRRVGADAPAWPHLERAVAATR